jgi:hypothetical protein
MATVVAQAHLDHHGGVTLGHDEIDFATAAAVVLGHQDQTLGFK